MNRLAKISGSFVVWAVSSGLLLFICVFSINQTIITSALIVAAVTFVASAIAFATKHDRIGIAFALAPALVIVGLLIMLAAVGYSEYHK